MKNCLRLSFALAVAVVWLTGCGGSGYTPAEGVIVTGKIVKGGAPLDVPNRDNGLGSVEVRFVLASGANPGLESGMVGADGSFKVVGAGAGIPPGSYKVAVFQRDRGMDSDMLQGAFSVEKTPITVEIPNNVGDSHDLGTIDLDTYNKQ